MTETYYCQPRWLAKNVFTGWGTWNLDYNVATGTGSNHLWDLTQCGGHFYIQSVRLHFWSGLTGGSEDNWAEYVDVNPPSLSALSSAFYSKYGYRSPTDGTWGGYGWRPQDGDNAWVSGSGSSAWDYDSHSCNYDPPQGYNSSHSNHTTSGDEDRVDTSAFPSTQVSSVSWTTEVINLPTHTDKDVGTYTSSTNVWTLSGSNVSLDVDEWHAKMVTAEAIVPTVINQNGLYPTNSSSAVAKYGTYDVAANTYTAGSTDKLNADGWYTEFLKARNGLAVARAEIDRLLGQNLDQVATEPPPREEELRVEEFDQSPWVHGGVADDPLVDFPEFPVVEFVEPEPVEEEPEAPDAVVAPGLLRRATFAKDTEAISSFSESTHNELTFTPRETVSPEFTDEGAEE
ncbi:hypothetical protein [uncultured Mediterranean phage]|nr:hypothetical protein [uncultured Mediterranean phage]